MPKRKALRPTSSAHHYSTAVRAMLEQVEPDAKVPEPLPWPGRWGSEKPILLVPAADYHLAELVPLSIELNHRGWETRFAVGASPWKRTKRGLVNHPDLEMYQLPDPAEVERSISAVVTMKDTGSMTDWVTEVRAVGIPVIGKVEGAQDFWDADTPEDRRPYRNLGLVLCQGQFDAEAMSDRETAIVGSSRLERLWWAPPLLPPEEPLALINLNFVYGVRTADRKLWLETAIEGCDLAGMPYVISLHPAEKSKLGPHMTRISASSLLPHSSVLISRFSTIPLEAMARGVPFIYHNPHGETVTTFSEPLGAFTITQSAQGVHEALTQQQGRDHRQRVATEQFFSNFVSVGEPPNSEIRGSEAILDHFR